MTIGEKIKKARTTNHLTQKELGKRLGGISQQQIGQWETGKANPKIETLQKIATALDIPLFEFLDDDYFDVATDEEPGSEENEIKFLNDKIIAIKELFNNGEATDKDKNNILYNHILQTEIMANMHRENAKMGDKYLFEMCYDMLNSEGRDKLRDFLLMLMKIPEYQVDNTMQQITKSYQDGNIQIVKREDSNSETKPQN